MTDWLDAARRDATAALGLNDGIVFPAALVEFWDQGVAELILEEEALPSPALAEPAPELSLFGDQMLAFFTGYEIAEYLPGAWPLGFDGAGGLYCLDLRAVIAGAAPNDGSMPLVWAHSGSLGWGEREHAPIHAHAEVFLREHVVEVD